MDRSTASVVTRTLFATAMLGVSTTALITGTAFAQNTTQPTNGGIEEIVVTAQKREQVLQDVPIAVSAVSSAYLKSRDISSIDSLGSIAPNVKIERAPSNKTISQIAIRGSVTINPAITWEPAVGLYLDGVYIAKAQGSIFDIADLERVEVLRGPQGTLYGRNSLAGAVSLVTRKPSGELGGSAELTYGNYDFWKAKAVLDLPAMGIFSIKLAGQIQKRDGYINVGPNPYPQAFLAGPPSVSDTNDLDNRSGMIQIRARPSDTITADYMFDYTRYKQRPDYAQLYKVNRNGDPRDIFDPNSVSYPFAGAFFPLNLYDRKNRQSMASLDGTLFERSRTYGHALTVEFDLGAASLKSISAYRNVKWSDSLDLDGSPLPVALTQRFTNYHAYSQELQLTGKILEDRLHYVVGAYYFKDTAKTNNPQFFFAGGTAFDSRYASHTDAIAVYAQADFSVTDRLTLTGGLRYTHEKKDITRTLILLNDATVPPALLPMTLINLPYGGVPDAKYNNVSPTANIRYEITDDVNVYARYAKGFKSGGFNGETNVVDAPTAACPSGAPELCDPYKAETVDSYEIGLKSKLLDNRLQLNIAGFWDEHKNLQLSVFLGTGAAASVVRNAASARIRGLEFEAIAKPIDWLTLNASFAVLDTKYKNFIDGGVNVSNNRAFPHAPKYTASLGADWTVAEGDYGKFNLIGDMNFVSSYYTFPYALTAPLPSDQTAEATRSQGRTIVNVRGVLSDIPLGGVKGQLSVWARNLLREKNPQNFIDFGPTFGGLTVAYFPDPRTYGVTMGVRF